MRKIFTFLTLIFFTTNTLVWGAPADAVSLLAGNSHAQDGLTIVHVQDAHSNYEAQKSIQEILKNLHEKEGFSFVALEGAWQPLAPEVYHFFPDAKSNLKAADFLAQKGEMSGAELYALELAESASSLRGAKRRSNLVFEGVEDPKVYREDYELFKKGLAAQDEVKKYCDDLFAKLDLEKSHVYSPEFLRFDRNVRDYENKRLDLAAFLRVLEKSAKEKIQIELTSPDYQREWPYLCRMLRVMNAAQGLDMEAVKKDASKLKINLEDKSLTANPRAFFESVYADSIKNNISLDGYKALRQYSEHLILKSEITGPELFAEIDSLIEKLSDIYAVSAKEKELLANSRQTRLLEKLLKYEATGKEWEKIKQMPIEAKASSAFHFYQLAESRNQILFENTLSKIKSQGVKKAILITGGFHSDGIEALAKQKNVSYRTILPQIHEEFSSQRYRRAVLGAWRKEIAKSKIPKPLGMVKKPYDLIERSENIKIAVAQVQNPVVHHNQNQKVIESASARSLGSEPSEKHALAKHLHADLFNKTISIEKRRRIAEEFIHLDHTLSLTNYKNASGRILDEIVRSATPNEAAERLVQISTILSAEAETEILETEAQGYKRNPDAVMLGHTGYQAFGLSVMMTDPVGYLEELENPSYLKPIQYFVIACMLGVSLAAFAIVAPDFFRTVAAAAVLGTFGLFLAAIIHSIIRAIVPAKASKPFDWENVFGPHDLAIFNKFRQEFWDGEHDFSEINKIENVSLKLALVSEVINAYRGETPVQPEEIEKFQGLLNDLKMSGKERLVAAAEKFEEFIADKFPEEKSKFEARRQAEGASLGQFDPLGDFEKELKKKWEDFFYQTSRLGMNLGGEDYEKFQTLRKARLAFLYYALIEGRSYDSFFWDWRRLPVYFSELPVKYHTLRTVEWLNLVFPQFAPHEIHSEEAAQERTDFLQQALHEIEDYYTEFLRFRFQGEDPMKLIPQAVSNALSETYLEVLENRGEEEILEYISILKGFLISTRVAERSNGLVQVVKIPEESEIQPETITLREAGAMDLSWDPILYERSVLVNFWNWLKEVMSGIRQLLSMLFSSYRVIQHHHELFLNYLELLQNREKIGMPQHHFGTAWDGDIVRLLDLDKMIDGLRQNPDFVVKVISQVMNTRDIAHRTYPDDPGILKQKLLARNSSIEIGKADSSKSELYRRQINELKDVIHEEKKRQREWQAANAKSLGGAPKAAVKMLDENQVLALKARVEKALGGMHAGIFAVGPFVLVNVIKPGFIVNATTMLELILRELIEKFKTRLEKKLGDAYEQSRRNILFVNPSLFIRAAKGDMPLSFYTLSMIEQMIIHAGFFPGAQVMDFGAGDGLLSRIALALGARKVVLAEKDNMPANVAGIFLNEDGWAELSKDRAEGYEIRKGDLKTKIFGKDVQSEALRAETGIVLANIGPWEGPYGDTNRFVVERASTWPAVSLILNGGYLFFKKFPPASLPEEGKKHLAAIQELRSLLKARGFETSMAAFLTAGTLIAIKTAKTKKAKGLSLGEKISEKFKAPRYSDDISKDKAWIILNVVVYSPNFLEETNKKLKLGLGNRPIRDFYIEKIPSNNKEIYKIRIVVDGGSTAEFVLYALQTEKIWNAIVSGYEKGAEFNRLNPGFRLFPKVGAVRLNHKMHWVSAEYVVPYSVGKKKNFQLTVDAYFRLFKAGWTLTDLYYEQIMLTRMGKKIQAKIIDLDYLRHLLTGDGHEDDLIEQVRKMFNSARQYGGKKELLETARIGKKYLPKEIILKGFLKFSEKIKGFKNIPSEDEMTTVLGMNLGSKAERLDKVSGASLGIENELKKFEKELSGKKVTDERLKEMVDWAESNKKFDDFRSIFVRRLTANENDFAAKRGLTFLNAREAGYHEFSGLIASVASLDGGQSPVRALAVSYDGKLFASGTESGIVKIWDVETGQLRYRFEEKGYGIKSLQFSANSRRIEANGTDLSSRVWDFNTGQKVTHSASVVTGKKYITFDLRPFSMKSSDSKRYLELETSGNVKVWDWNSRNHLQSRMLYEISGKDILSIDISSDDRFFVTGSRDGRVIVWDFQTDQPRPRAFLGGNSAAVYAVKFSPDGNWLISGSSDQSVKLWAGHERSLIGFWQRFKLGFQLSDAEVKAVQDYVDFLARRENYSPRSVMEAYGESWQMGLAEMAAVQARKLAGEPNRDPKWKNDPVWLQDALAEFLHIQHGFIPQKQRDKLIIIEDETRHQLGIPHPRPQTNTFWNDGQNILLVLELLRRSKPAINLPDPIFPQTSGLSLGNRVISSAETFAGGILPFWMYTSSLYPTKPKAVVVSGGFSVTVKMNDNFNLEAERKYLREHPHSVSVVLDRTGRIQEEDRLIVIPVKMGQEVEAIQSLLSGKDFTKLAKLARKLYEKPGVRLKQSAIHKRITIEASSSLLNQIGLTGAVQLLEIPDVDELSALKINSREFSAYALVHAALLGRAEGNLNDPLLKPFRANIERDPVTGIYRIVRNSLADRIAELETSLDVSRKILAAA